jgi:hypothetical protein
MYRRICWSGGAGLDNQQRERGKDERKRSAGAPRNKRPSDVTDRGGSSAIGDPAYRSRLFSPRSRFLLTPHLRIETSNHCQQAVRRKGACNGNHPVAPLHCHSTPSRLVTWRGFRAGGVGALGRR